MSEPLSPVSEKVHAAVELRPAWRLSDPAIERDAEIFWKREGVLGPRADVPKRLSELCMAAYVDGEVVGLTSAAIQQIDSLRCKLAMFRCAVARTIRSQRVASQLTLATRDLLEAWSRDNPDEEVLGFGCIVQSRVLVENHRWAVWPDNHLAFVGYTPRGYPMRVYWFQHAKIAPYWPGITRDQQRPPESA